MSTVFCVCFEGVHKNIYFLMPLSFQNHLKTTIYLYIHRGIHTHIIWSVYQISFLTLFDYIIALLQYIIKRVFIVGGGLLLVFGTAAIYKCSAVTECTRRVCTIRKSTWFYSYLRNKSTKVAKRKPVYNIGMLCALVQLRLVSRV